MNLAPYLTPDYLQYACAKLSMPAAVTELLLPLSQKYDFSRILPYAPLLFHAETGAEGEKKISALLSEEPDAEFLWLILYLAGSGLTHERYLAMHIPDRIFIDTMYQLTSYVLEYYERFGHYGFDRHYWAYRQLSQTIYRIGLLEFERVFSPAPIFRDGRVIIPSGQRYLQIHIPAYAKLSYDATVASLRQAQRFFQTFYPDEPFACFACSTWLLDPKLHNFLPDHSNIIAFQRVFSPITRIAPDDSYRRWLYGFSDIKPENFSENTSLQRKVKEYVLSGGEMGIGEAFLFPDQIESL